MADGHQIVFEQEGDEAPETTPGDVIFKVKTLPHKRFTRRGNDLYASVNVTLLEALVGFSKKLKHLDGHEVEIKKNGKRSSRILFIDGKTDDVVTSVFPSMNKILLLFGTHI